MRKIFIVLFLITLFSCEKEINITQPTIIIRSEYFIVNQTITIEVIQYADIDGEVQQAEYFEWIITDSDNNVHFYQNDMSSVIDWVPDSAGNFMISVKIGYNNNKSITTVKDIKVEGGGDIGDDWFNYTFSPKFITYAGIYNEDLSIKITSENEDAKIYYTLDSSVPDTNSIEYTEPIKVLGDGNVVKIKAVAYGSKYGYSVIVESYYYIDYSYNSNNILTGLSLEDFKNNIIGEWIGYNSNPWTGPYNIKVTFINQLKLEAYSISHYKYPSGDEWIHPPFYYEPEGVGSYELIEVNDGYKAIGTINQLNMKNMIFVHDYNNIEFELLWQNTYGPIRIILTRIK